MTGREAAPPWEGGAGQTSHQAVEADGDGTGLVVRGGGPFAQIPAHLIYDPVVAPHLRVLAVLCHRAHYLTGVTDDRCSVRALAAALELKPRTIRWHLTWLLERGIVVLHEPVRGIRAPRYRLPWVYPQCAVGPRTRPVLVRGGAAQGARWGRALVRGGAAPNTDNRISPDAGASASDPPDWMTTPPKRPLAEIRALVAEAKML